MPALLPSKRVRGHFGFISLMTFAAAAGQSPFDVAGDHYQRVFENDWVQVTRVIYGPYEKAVLHDHPDRPTIYIYTTDGGLLRFSHADGRVIERKPVKAGGIRFSGGVAERHSVESLSAIPSEYLRIEIKLEPFDRPERDIRLDPESHAADETVNKLQFENKQLRIVRVVCGPYATCPGSTYPAEPAIVVFLTGARINVTRGAGHAVARQYRSGEVLWVPGETPPVDATNLDEQPVDQVRVELKVNPAS